MTQLMAFSAAHPWLWLCGLAGLGLIIGSFLNVVISRLPLILARQWQQERCWQPGCVVTISSEPVTLLWPRSRCIHCHHPIAMRDVLPVMGWIGLRGSSRCCQRPIAWRYPAVEMLTALLFVMAGWRWMPGVELLGALMLISVLLALATIDAETLLLPDALTLPLMWIGMVCNLAHTFVALESAVIGSLAGYLSLRMLARLSQAMMGKEGLGRGDAKLLAALGAWLGWQALPSILLFAALSSLMVIGVWRSVRGNSLRQPLAFGPWLALGGGAALLIPEFLALPSQ